MKASNWFNVQGLGKIAYLIGIFGAIILGVLSRLGMFEMGAGLTLALVIAGIVIGLLNVTEKEAVPLMVASLVIGGGAGLLNTLPMFGSVIEGVLQALTVVMLPAGIVIAIVVAIKKAN